MVVFESAGSLTSVVIGTLLDLSRVTGFSVPELQIFSGSARVLLVPFASDLRRIFDYLSHVSHLGKDRTLKEETKCGM